MGEPGMKWFFEERRGNGGGTGDAGGTGDGNQDGRGDGESAPDLTILPAPLLQRHGAVALDPGTAAEIPTENDRGPTPPRSTVYRARTLLIPGDLLFPPGHPPDEDSPFLQQSNMVLARLGMRMIRPPADRAGARPGGILSRLPRPVVLVPAAPGDDVPARPVVINAWVALQALRAAVPSPEHDALDETSVSRITLEHLLISSAIAGSGAHGHGGGLGGGTDGSSGVTGPTTTDSYTYSGGDTRTPVMVAADAPPREPADVVQRDYGRRPVVAVLDTGVRAHTWLGVEPQPAGTGSGYDFAPDSFVEIDQAIQDALFAESDQAAIDGDRPRRPIRYPWDQPVTANSLVGELDTDTGHGTFIAGLVRQVAPDAKVLAVRIMHSNGIVNEGDLIHALGLLAERVEDAEAGDMDTMVDVVSLSLGYFDETPDDVTFSSGLWLAIEELLGLGVTVLAAAGNYATRREFYPAAFTRLLQPGQVPLISVGALNPNGSKALFSDEGTWVTAWASGAAVVSTFPTDINCSRSPEIETQAYPAGEMPPAAGMPRQALDQDDYSGGFAVWSGTSFSAPLLAARIARALLEDAGTAALRLDQSGQDAATARAMAALEQMGWPG